MHLGELADVICGPFGSAITNKDYQESGIPLIRITNISGDGYMDYSDIIYISEELGNSLSRTQVSAGDIVISQRGSLGQCAIDHKGIDRDFFRYNICCNAACASDSGDIYTIAFILGAPYSEALCGFSAAYIQRPSI